MGHLVGYDGSSREEYRPVVSGRSRFHNSLRNLNFTMGNLYKPDAPQLSTPTKRPSVH